MKDKDEDFINDLARSCGSYLDALAYLIMLGRVEIINYQNIYRIRIRKS